MNTGELSTTNNANTKKLEFLDKEEFRFGENSFFAAFEDVEIIDVYSDKDALEDGVLIDIQSLNLSYRNKPLNRMTSTVYDELTKLYGTMLQDDEEYESEVNLAEIVPKILGSVTKDDGFLAIAFYNGETYWMTPNEVGGITLMKSEDY